MLPEPKGIFGLLSPEKNNISSSRNKKLLKTHFNHIPELKFRLDLYVQKIGIGGDNLLSNVETRLLCHKRSGQRSR